MEIDPTGNAIDIISNQHVSNIAAIVGSAILIETGSQEPQQHQPEGNSPSQFFIEPQQNVVNQGHLEVEQHYIPRQFRNPEGVTLRESCMIIKPDYFNPAHY